MKRPTPKRLDEIRRGVGGELVESSSAHHPSFLCGDGDAIAAELLHEIDALRAELTAAQHVWDELSTEVGCSSPDGCSELEQVRYRKELQEAAEAEAARLREAHAQLWADYEATAWMLAELTTQRQE